MQIPFKKFIENWNKELSTVLNINFLHYVYKDIINDIFGWQVINTQEIKVISIINLEQR